MFSKLLDIRFGSSRNILFSFTAINEVLRVKVAKLEMVSVIIVYVTYKSDFKCNSVFLDDERRRFPSSEGHWGVQDRVIADRKKERRAETKTGRQAKA